MQEKIFQNQLNESLRKFKSNIAVQCGNHRVTYGQLDRHSHGITAWMIKNGIKEETFIGILADDRIVIISAIIGILKARSVFVPLDTSNPPPRLEKMIEITKIKLIFVDKNNYARYSTSSFIKEGNIEVVVVEDLLSLTDTRGAALENGPGVDYSSEDKIYIYFTSGSTGVPKAVIGKNGSLLHYCQWEKDTINIDENFRICQLAAVGFDAFLKEVFVTLLSGGTLCVPESSDIPLHPGKLLDWLEESGITLVHCVPAIFRSLNSNPLTKSNLVDLKYILLAGEVIYPGDLKDWYDIFDERIQIVNLYGTTETTILTSYYFIQKTDIARERIPIGKPMKGARMIVLDNNMNVCNKGTVGEIYIRTRYRSLGYLDSHELNMKKFIPNPFNNNPDDIIFKTGDSGRFLLDGNIEMLGRTDRQVKIRGIRIEPGEIEGILVEHTAVKEAVVIKKELSNHDGFLCAFVTGSEKNPMDKESLASALKEYLFEKLPNYMVPARIVIPGKIPRKPNGKVDYSELTTLLKDEIEYIPPRDEIEKKLLETWKIILKVEKIGIKNSFFELGGNSLNVMSLISKIHKEFDARPTIGEIFNNPTIEMQAKIIKEIMQTEQEEELAQFTDDLEKEWEDKN